MLLLTPLVPACFALQNADLQALPLMNHLKNLTNLNVSGNNLTSLEPLRDMLSIEYLSFQGNSISNLEPISGLSKLRFLYMSKNKVDRVSPIATLLDLESLFASHNCIEDFPVLRRLRASHRNSQDQIIALNVNGDVGQPEVCE